MTEKCHKQTSPITWPPRSCSRHNGLDPRCPLLPRKRTWSGARRMSAKCHERTHAAQQIASLFDHLVGGRLQCERHCNAERLGGLEINHQLEFGRLHDWQVGGLLSFENTANIDAGLTERVC